MKFSKLSSIFPTVPPQTAAEGLPAVNVDNNMIMTVGECSSSSSKRWLKRKSPPSENLESQQLDFNADHSLDNTYGTRQVQPVATPPVQQGLPESNIITVKRRKDKKDVDRDSRNKKNATMQNLKDDVEKLKMDKAKMEGHMEASNAENAKLLAALESYKIALAEMEKNMAHIKICEDIRKQIVARLHKLIGEDVSCNIDKEELWAKFYNPDGKQTFQKYWEETKNYKHELRAIAEMLLLLPQ